MSRTAQRGTIQLPVTPSVEALIRQYRSRLRRIFAITIASPVGLAVLMIVFVGSKDNSLGILVLGAIGSALLAAIVIPAWLLTDGRRLARDIRDGVYCRTAGPVTWEGSYSNRSVFYIGDARVIVGRNSDLHGALKNLPWAVIDYTPNARVIFEVRNRAGETLYVREGYRHADDRRHGLPA